MSFFSQVIDFFLHLDKHLGQIISDYGGWTYGILFLTIFCETGLVVTPFLPGDSLLFAAGALAAIGALNPHYLFLLLVAGGDSRQHGQLLDRSFSRTRSIREKSPFSEEGISRQDPCFL